MRRILGGLALSFWTSGRREQFREALRVAFKVLNIGPDHVDDYVRRHAPRHGFARVAGKRTVERFLAGKTKTGQDTLSAILIGLAEDLRLQPHLPVKDLERLTLLMELYSVHEREVSSPPINSPRVIQSKSVTDKLSAEGAISEVADLALAYLHLPSDASAQCERIFFRDTDIRRAFFKTYRFTSHEAMVQKSLTVVHRPTAAIQIMRFANYFQYENRPRMSSGVVLKFGREIVFFGQSDKGESVKTLVFNHASAPQDRYTGLVLTNEPDGSTVAARFVMQRTDVEHHSGAGTGCYPLHHEAIELNEVGKQRLRNRIPFTLEQDLIDGDGGIVSQKTMVVKMEEFLSKGRLPDGRSLALKLADGEFFNPADHEFYTFNSALKIRD